MDDGRQVENSGDEGRTEAAVTGWTMPMDGTVYGRVALWTLLAVWVSSYIGQGIVTYFKVESATALLWKGMLTVQVLGLVVMGAALYPHIRRDGFSAWVPLFPKNQRRWKGLLHVAWLFPVCCCGVLVLLGILERVGVTMTEQPLLKLAETEADNLFFWISGFFNMLLVTPLSEEVFFRLLTHEAIRARVGEKWAAVMTSFIFAAMHGAMCYLLPLMFLGWMFHVARRRGGLLAAIMLHGCYDACQWLWLMMSLRQQR